MKLCSSSIHKFENYYMNAHVVSEDWVLVDHSAQNLQFVKKKFLQPKISISNSLIFNKRDILEILYSTIELNLFLRTKQDMETGVVHFPNVVSVGHVVSLTIFQSEQHWKQPQNVHSVGYFRVRVRVRGRLRNEEAVQRVKNVIYRINLIQQLSVNHGPWC